MGADIHLVLEKKFNDQWVGINDFSYRLMDAMNNVTYEHSFPARGRNYDLFAALAGVRGNGPEPKGLPDDASLLTQMELSDTDDLHSHTWYPLEEAVSIFIRAYDEIPAVVAAKLLDEKQKKSPLTKYFGLYDDYEFNIADYRLCIAFDN